MQPELRFHTIVVSATVVVMFGAIVFVQPLVQPLSTSVKVAGFVIAALASAGTYKSLAGLLDFVLRKWRWLREKLLGDTYLEGTWVGFFVGHGGDVRLFYEHFRQTLTSLVIQGNSYELDNTSHGDWVSVTANHDAANGRLLYAYTCNIISRSVQHEGIAVFNVRRPTPNAPADSLEGYSADLVDGHRSPSREIKVSTHFLDRKSAIEKAREFARSEGALK